MTLCYDCAATASTPVDQALASTARSNQNSPTDSDGNWTLHDGNFRAGVREQPFADMDCDAPVSSDEDTFHEATQRNCPDGAGGQNQSPVQNFVFGAPTSVLGTLHAASTLLTRQKSTKSKRKLSMGFPSPQSVPAPAQNAQLALGGETKFGLDSSSKSVSSAPLPVSDSVGSGKAPGMWEKLAKRHPPTWQKDLKNLSEKTTWERVILTDAATNSGAGSSSNKPPKQKRKSSSPEPQATQTGTTKPTLQWDDNSPATVIQSMPWENGLWFRPGFGNLGVQETLQSRGNEQYPTMNEVILHSAQVRYLERELAKIQSSQDRARFAGNGWLVLKKGDPEHMPLGAPVKLTVRMAVST